nr:5376_t:CDS:10 [Entrophospora candida]
MSASQTSNPASFQSSVGVTSTEELAEKYQKLFTEFSRIKAQHSVLKKAVIKERATNDTLKEECKTKEQELRISLQQLDLLTFHNQRLTKRIECLQEPTTLVKRLSPVWLMGSAKKELERSKITLETISKELQRKIEENEKLHKELFDVNSTYTEHENDLKEKISKLEKFNEEIQLELKRSGDASEEALSTIRREKSELENELDQTKNDLRMYERNEQNLKKSDDYIQAEIDALKEILFINLGLTHEGDNGIQFNELGDKMDPESREIIASFKQLQSKLGLKVKKASQSWQNSLQLLATKLSNAQDRVSELTTEKEILVKTNEADSNKVTNLEAEINRLKEELAKQKENVLYTEKGFNDSEDEEYTMISGENENEESLSPSFSLSKKKSNNNISENSNHHRQLQQKSSLDGNNEDEYLEVKMEDDQSNNISITNEMFDGTEINGTSSDLASIRRDIGRAVKSDDSKQREGLIHKNYEIKIQKLTEKLQYADSKCLRLSKALKTVQARMAEFESIIKNNAQENENSQTEITLLRTKLDEERANYERQFHEMTDYIDQQSVTIKNLNDRLAEVEDEFQFQEHS